MTTDVLALLTVVRVIEIVIHGDAADETLHLLNGYCCRSLALLMSTTKVHWGAKNLLQHVNNSDDMRLVGSNPGDKQPRQQFALKLQLRKLLILMTQLLIHIDLLLLP